LKDFDEKTCVTQVVHPSTGPGAPLATTDCLVIIYTKEPTLLGKRFLLQPSATRVGRGADNHIVLDGESISRRHAQFERRDDAWFVVDLDSSNGTYCNDKKISREVALKDGDRVKVGPTLFKFLSGADVVAQYHEEIYRMTIMDGLTQIHNKRYLYEALDREIQRSWRSEHDLSILMFDIDHLKRVNDVHGHSAGDFVLRELSRVVQARIRHDEVFARYGGEEFSIILPQTSLDEAVALAEALRQKVSDHLFVFETNTIRVTISIGAALLRESDSGAIDFIKRADEYLYFAKNTGRNRVAASPDVESGSEARPSAHRNHHAVIDAVALLERSLRAHPHGHLLAFEIEDEAAVVAHLGSSTYRAWYGEIVSDVDQAIGKDDTLAMWRERYVIAALHGVTPAAVASTVSAITARWTARLPPGARSAVQRGLRAAVLTPQELAQLGKRALDVLVGRLCAAAGHRRPRTISRSWWRRPRRRSSRAAPPIVGSRRSWMPSSRP
jgi:two-component system, cell cycle response regulator